MLLSDGVSQIEGLTGGRNVGNGVEDGSAGAGNVRVGFGHDQDGNEIGVMSRTGGGESNTRIGYVMDGGGGGRNMTAAALEASEGDGALTVTTSTL